MIAFLAERRSTFGLRLVVLLGPVLALLGTGLSGPSPRGWLIALTVALALGFAAMPESALGTSVLCLVVVWWGLALDDVSGVPVEAAGAAVALLAAHVSALVMSYGPTGLPMNGAVLRTWLRRGLLLAAAVDGQPEPPGIWVAGLAAAVVVCVVAASAVVVPDPSGDRA